MSSAVDSALSIRSGNNQDNKNTKLFSDPSNICSCDRGETDVDSVYQDLAKLVHFMQEDEDHVVLRRFDDLQLFHLVALQHQLTDADKIVRDLRRHGDSHSITAVLSQLGPLLTAYDEALSRYERMQKRQTLPQNVLKTLCSKALNGKAAALRVELPTGENWQDLMAIASIQEKGLIHKFVDNHESLRKLFYEDREKKRQIQIDLEKGIYKEDSAKQLEEYWKHVPRSGFYFYNGRHVRIVEDVLLSIILCALIVVPISTLGVISSRSLRNLLILACVILAFLVSLLLSRQTQRNNLALILTYGAILVVFANNTSITQS